MIAWKQGQNEESIRILTEIQETHPGLALSYDGLAISQFKERQYENGKLYGEKAIQQDPTSARANCQPIRTASRADPAKPRLEMVQELKSMEFRVNGRSRRALAGGSTAVTPLFRFAARICIATPVDSVRAGTQDRAADHDQRGVKLLEQGLWDPAITDFEEVLRLAPDQAETYDVYRDGHRSEQQGPA